MGYSSRGIGLGMAQPVIVRSLYRACMKLSKELSKEVKSHSRTTEKIEMGKLYPISMEPDESIQSCVRRGFRMHAGWHDPEDIEAEIENGFTVLRLAGLRLNQLRAIETYTPRPEHVAFEIGQVV